MAGPSPIDELSSTLGEINATLRGLKERMADAALEQSRRESAINLDLRDIKNDQRANERLLTALDQKIGAIESQLQSLYTPEPVSQRVKRLEADIQELNKERWRATGVVLAISMFAGLFANWLLHFIPGWVFGGTK
jgi:chromosome segregation ATPase